MATYDETDQFWRDFGDLTREQKIDFLAASRKFNADLDANTTPRGSLRVSPLKGWPGIFELTYEGNNGRATFEYGAVGTVAVGKKHVVWRRVGTHDIFSSP